MKTRFGFVSNSSSQSFCIYGAIFDRDDVLEMAKKLDIEVPEDEDEAEENFDELREKVADKTKLEFHTPGDYDSGSTYVGRSWSSIQDDETGQQFKTRIETQLKVLLGKDVKCGTEEEAWRDE